MGINSVMESITKLDALRQERHDAVEAGDLKRSVEIKKMMCETSPNHRCDLCRACRGWKKGKKEQRRFKNERN